MMNFISILLLLISFLAIAKEKVEEPKGFMWYKEGPARKIEEKTEEKKASLNAKTTQAHDRNQALKKKLEDAIAVALDNPTMQNVIEAKKLQKEVMDKSQYFANVWTVATLVESGFISKDEHHNTLHNKISKQQREFTQHERLKEMAKEFGLFFQFDESCHHCARFAPIIREFANEHNFQVLAISEAGNDYQGFPGAKDTGLMIHLNPDQVVPVVYLVHKDGERIYPIARGIIDADEIRDNIFNIEKVTGKL